MAHFPAGRRSDRATTINEYERILTKVVVPELGGLRLREVTTSRLDIFLVRLRSVSAQRPEHGPEGGPHMDVQGALGSEGEH